MSSKVVRLVSADGEFLEMISCSRLSRLQGLDMIRRVATKKDGTPKLAILWPRDTDTLLTRVGQSPYSKHRPIDKTSIYRIWKLMRIESEDRPVFQASITDNLVFVDPATGEKRKAA